MVNLVQGTFQGLTVEALHSPVASGVVRVAGAREQSLLWLPQRGRGGGGGLFSFECANLGRKCLPSLF